jgi:hypothetical protein
MSDLDGAELFERLSEDDKARYIAIHKRMVDFARDHAVPIMLAPPPGGSSSRVSTIRHNSMPCIKLPLLFAFAPKG